MGLGSLGLAILGLVDLGHLGVGLGNLGLRVRDLGVRGKQLRVRGKELRVSVRVQPGPRVRVGGTVRELRVRVSIRASL